MYFDRFFSACLKTLDLKLPDPSTLSDHVIRRPLLSIGSNGSALEESLEIIITFVGSGPVPHFNRHLLVHALGKMVRVPTQSTYLFGFSHSSNSFSTIDLFPPQLNIPFNGPAPQHALSLPPILIN